MKTIKMPCADCGGEVHDFTEMSDQPGDYVGECGWMQRSFHEGKIEQAEALLYGIERKLSEPKSVGEWADTVGELREEVQTARAILNMTPEGT